MFFKSISMCSKNFIGFSRYVGREYHHTHEYNDFPMKFSNTMKNLKLFHLWIAGRCPDGSFYSRKRSKVRLKFVSPFWNRPNHQYIVRKSNFSSLKFIIVLKIVFFIISISVLKSCLQICKYKPIWAHFDSTMFYWRLLELLILC